MKPKLQKQSALKLAVELSREAEDKATSRELRRIPPQAGGRGDYKSRDALFSYWVKNVFFKEIQDSYLHRYSSYHGPDYVFL